MKIKNVIFAAFCAVLALGEVGAPEVMAVSAENEIPERDVIVVYHELDLEDYLVEDRLVRGGCDIAQIYCSEEIVGCIVGGRYVIRDSRVVGKFRTNSVEYELIREQGLQSSGINEAEFAIDYSACGDTATSRGGFIEDDEAMRGDCIQILNYYVMPSRVTPGRIAENAP